jgi:hypothetical protein
VAFIVVIIEVAAPLEANDPVSVLRDRAVRIKGRVRRVCVRVEARVGVAGDGGGVVATEVKIALPAPGVRREVNPPEAVVLALAPLVSIARVAVVA